MARESRVRKMKAWNRVTIILALVPIILLAGVAAFSLAAPKAGKEASSYKRALWKHWVDEDKDCQDTRTEVLIRDARPSTIKYKGEKECEVRSGEWVDPYTGKTFNDPAKLDVDHLVPLKQAHDSGGLAWPREKRALYANYLGYRWHLVAVDASENRKKGAKGPDEYRPPLKSTHCQYAQAWGSVKAAWGLRTTATERAAMLEMLATCTN